MLSRPNSGSCSPQQQWFMWSSFFSFFLHTLEGKISTSLQLLCQQLPIFHNPPQQSPSQGHRVHQLRCALAYKADATGTWFAAEELIASSSPSLNPSCLLLLLQPRPPWPEPTTRHTDCCGLAISLCLCKGKIYHYRFDQPFLGPEIESEKQARLLLNAQYGIQAQTC